MGIIFERHDLVQPSRGKRVVQVRWPQTDDDYSASAARGMQTLYVSCWSLFRDQLLSLSKIGTLILKLSFGLR